MKAFRNAAAARREQRDRRTTRKRLEFALPAPPLRSSGAEDDGATAAELRGRGRRPDRVHP